MIAPPAAWPGSPLHRLLAIHWGLSGGSAPVGGLCPPCTLQHDTSLAIEAALTANAAAFGLMHEKLGLSMWLRG